MSDHRVDTAVHEDSCVNIAPIFRHSTFSLKAEYGQPTENTAHHEDKPSKISHYVESKMVILEICQNNLNYEK